MNTSLYAHIPFCRERCTYCAFNTYTDRNALMDDYVQALCTEVRWLGANPLTPPLHTIYFGGGTPSLLTPAHYGQILENIHQSFTLTSSVEITLEANPGTVTESYFRELLALGVNRFSLGVQSAHASELTLFGRWHGWAEVEIAVRDARQAGVTNLSLDLIYGVPNQTLEMWQASVEAVLNLAPDHLSFYSLGLESGTEMTRRVRYGELPDPDADLAADMYEWATERLAEAGFVQYEISNWGKPDKFCRHNIQYWRNEPYFGIGAGAHGYARQTRTVNAMRPEDYIKRLSNATTPEWAYPATPATISAEVLDDATDQFETLFMGLRLLDEGLSLQDYEQRHGVRIEEKFADVLAWLVEHDLIRHTPERLFLTPRARLISNQVFTRFMEETE